MLHSAHALTGAWARERTDASEPNVSSHISGAMNAGPFALGRGVRRP